MPELMSVESLLNTPARWALLPCYKVIITLYFYKLKSLPASIIRETFTRHKSPVGLGSLVNYILYDVCRADDVKSMRFLLGENSAFIKKDTSLFNYFLFLSVRQDAKKINAYVMHYLKQLRENDPFSSKATYENALSIMCKTAFDSKRYDIVSFFIDLHQDKKPVIDIIYDHAIFSWNIQHLAFMAEKGYPITYNDNNAAKMAAINNKPELLIAIIDKGGFIEHTEILTLRLVIRKEYVDILKIILSKQHNLTLFGNKPLICMENETTISPAIAREMLFFLLDQGMDIELRDDSDDFYITILGNPSDILSSWPEKYAGSVSYLIHFYLKQSGTTVLHYLTTCPLWHKSYVGKLLTR